MVPSFAVCAQPELVRDHRVGEHRVGVGGCLVCLFLPDGRDKIILWTGRPAEDRRWGSGRDGVGPSRSLQHLNDWRERA